jgi:hypothetical protein
MRRKNGYVSLGGISDEESLLPDQFQQQKTFFEKGKDYIWDKYDSVYFNIFGKHPASSTPKPTVLPLYERESSYGNFPHMKESYYTLSKKQEDEMFEKHLQEMYSSNNFKSVILQPLTPPSPKPFDVDDSTELFHSEFIKKHQLPPSLPPSLPTTSTVKQNIEFQFLQNIPYICPLSQSYNTNDEVEKNPP